MASKRDEIKARLAQQGQQGRPDVPEAQAAVDELVPEPVEGERTGTLNMATGDVAMDDGNPPSTPETPESIAEAIQGPAGPVTGELETPTPDDAHEARQEEQAEAQVDTRNKRQIVAAYKLALKPLLAQLKAHKAADKLRLAKKEHDGDALLAKRDLTQLIATIEGGESVLTTYADAKAAVAAGGKPPTIAWLARSVASATSQDMVRKVLDLAGVDFQGDANALSVEAARKAREAKAAASGATRSASSTPTDRKVKSGLTRTEADAKFMAMHKAGKGMTEISEALGYGGRPIRNMYYKRLGVKPNVQPRAVKATQTPSSGVQAVSSGRDGRKVNIPPKLTPKGLWKRTTLGRCKAGDTVAQVAVGAGKAKIDEAATVLTEAGKGGTAVWRLAKPATKA